MRLEDQTVSTALGSIAAKQATPGGGAVASLTAAIGAALAEMVVNFSVGKKKLAEHGALHQVALETLQRLRSESLGLAVADAAAYGRLNELWRLDAADERRRREFPDAVEEAIDVPRRVANAGIELGRLLDRLCGRSNAMLASDLAIAAVLAEAAVGAAVWNIRINLPLIEDRAAASRIADKATELIEEAGRLCRRVEDACRIEG